MSLFNVLLGKPLATSEERAEHIGPIAGIPVFGLDALSSAAYGPEAALTLLIPLGLAGVAYIVPISFAIIALLAIVYFSYCQTIEAYPHGGGSYTVATENLGETAGLLAAAALMIDYILNAAVGISAGVGALISAFPKLQPHTLGLCLLILAILTLINMRGTKDTGAAFLIPTYLFIGSLLFVIIAGAIRAVLAHGHPTPVVSPPTLPAAASMLSLWLLLKVFASGCTAMTGVEAVSNGVNAFRQPVQRNAKRTLTIIIVLLMLFLSGIAFSAAPTKSALPILAAPGIRASSRSSSLLSWAAACFTTSRSPPYSQCLRSRPIPRSRIFPVSPAPLRRGTTYPTSLRSAAAGCSTRMASMRSSASPHFYWECSAGSPIASFHSLLSALSLRSRSPRRAW